MRSERAREIKVSRECNGYAEEAVSIAAGSKSSTCWEILVARCFVVLSEFHTEHSCFIPKIAAALSVRVDCVLRGKRDMKGDAYAKRAVLFGDQFVHGRLHAGRNCTPTLLPVCDPCSITFIEARRDVLASYTTPMYDRNVHV